MMMKKFDQFLNMMEVFLAERGYPITLGNDTSRLSCNMHGMDGEETFLCKSKLQAVDMDRFAQAGYRKIMRPTSESVRDSVNTADAFVINACNEWYFIEFKDGSIHTDRMKTHILRKAYSNLYAVLDVLYAMRQTEDAYQDFDYENPIDFIRNNVSYVLVFSKDKNYDDATQAGNRHLVGERYVPEFMERLPGYIYKEAYAITEDDFDLDFARHFMY